jgi:predicted nucleic acid-binding protein
LSAVVYLDTSAVLRAVLERGVDVAIERRLASATVLMTSRLSLVESARAFIRLRLDGVPEATLADAAREVDSLWARCAIWELSPAVCDLAAQVAPRHRLRTLDALHLATYVLARRQLGDEISLLSTDARLVEASGIA